MIDEYKSDSSDSDQSSSENGSSCDEIMDVDEFKKDKPILLTSLHSVDQHNNKNLI